MSNKYQKTRALYQRAKQVIPYGVHSNFRYGGEETVIIARGKGGHIWDVDGNEFIDYRLAFGPVILGHADERVTARVTAALEGGNLYAHTHPMEVTVAERMVRMCPGLDMVRFANSGTEATMHAIRLARAHTGRDVVLKFQGCYHGFQDYTLWSTAGSPASAAGSARSLIPMQSGSGIPRAIRDLVLVAPFNDPEALERIVKARWGDIAAIIIEPIMGNAASVMPEPGFLEFVRAQCDAHGIVMIMDEVKTGFRIGNGGATEYFGVQGHLMTYAKAMANGFPIAAFGGCKEVMSTLVPYEVSIGGTYCGNMVGAAAADATLEIMETTPVLAQIASYGEKLKRGLSDIMTEAGIEHAMLGPAAMPGFIVGTSKQPKNFRDVTNSDLELYAKIAKGMFELGVEYEDDPREPFFLCAAHNDSDLGNTLERFNDAVGAVRP